MAELPRIVMALNGSATLRTASQAFSFGVIGFTCGPSRNRAYQLTRGRFLRMGKFVMNDPEAEHGTNCASILAESWAAVCVAVFVAVLSLADAPAAASWPSPSAASADADAAPAQAMPTLARFTRQGVSAGSVGGAGLCACGAFGNAAARAGSFCAHARLANPKPADSNTAALTGLNPCIASAPRTSSSLPEWFSKKPSPLPLGWTHHLKGCANALGHREKLVNFHYRSLTRIFKQRSTPPAANCRIYVCKTDFSPISHVDHGGTFPYCIIYAQCRPAHAEDATTSKLSLGG